jgi:DNA-binding NarL/FixJ family response regulator
MQRLLVLAENSLMLEAIALGLRGSGEFKLVGHASARGGSWRLLVETTPADVVLIDDGEELQLTVDLLSYIRRERPRVALLVLVMTVDPERLDAMFAAGASGAISKSTHPSALATLVRETTNGHILYRHREAGDPGGEPLNAIATEDSSLTSRELEVLRLVAAGSTNGEIARHLWVTEQTVKFHLSNVFRKLHVSNRTEASHYAHVNGLLNGPPQPLSS